MPLEDGAARIVETMQALSMIDGDLYGRWFLKGRRRHDALQAEVLPTPEDVTARLTRNRADFGSEVVPELGFTLSVWNGATDDAWSSLWPLSRSPARTCATWSTSACPTVSSHWHRTSSPLCGGPGCRMSATCGLRRDSSTQSAAPWSIIHARGFANPPRLEAMRRKKTPQEKKQLSLRKDRRNAYGENDKASRKAVPLRKAKVNRANRHSDNITLSGALGAPDEDLDEAAEQRLLGRRRKVWRKWPDEPLGQQIRKREGDQDLPWDPSGKSFH